MKVKIKIQCSYCGKKLKRIDISRNFYFIKNENMLLYYCCFLHVKNAIIENEHYLWKIIEDNPFQVISIVTKDNSNIDRIIDLFFNAVTFEIEAYKNRKEYIINNV